MAPRIRAALTALAVAGAIVVAASAVARARSGAAAHLSEQRLRRARRSGRRSGSTDGRSYGVIERSAHGGARVLVAYDTATGSREVLADATLLTPPGAAAPLAVASYAWSPDRRRALLFTNTRKVWRENTRGDYWLLDRDARSLRKLGGDAPESSLMFAKLSPDGSHVAYVREHNLYVEPLATAARFAQLTQGRIADDRQRHVRLGERGGARHPRRVPLEPRRPLDRLLAVRRVRRRGVHADQRHRQRSTRPSPGFRIRRPARRIPPCASASSTPPAARSAG